MGIPRWLGDPVVAVCGFGGPYVDALGAGNFYDSSQGAGEMVQRACYEVVIRTGCPSQVLGEPLS